MGVLYICNQLMTRIARKYQISKRLFGVQLIESQRVFAVSPSNYYILFDFAGATLYVAQHAVTQFS